MSQIEGNDGSPMNILVDFVNQATNEIAKFKVPFVLSPERMTADQYSIANLNWKSVTYGKAELTKVPNNRRGVYAFAISQESNVLPPHGYILYIGIAGRDSDRPLRARYREYLDPKKVLKRSGVARMIGTWGDNLRFFFAPVDDDFSTVSLQELEKELNTALMPPFTELDMDADVKRKRRAFRL